ncbi:MAG TPA: fumarylacetoacetate hydrolase family protein [Bacteroidota bacterium]|nr:fumarylacetoacetate hydrolase family protein [Bacteroidota bacterium]
MKTAEITGTGERFTVGKIVCIGQNYAEHIKEMKGEMPKSPVFFLKPTTAMIRNGEEIVLPSISNDVHHEVELTVLIGRDGTNIPREQAVHHIAGYGVGLDMTLRDIQGEAKKKGLPWTLAKGFDTSAPVSTFVPASRVKDSSALHLQLKVNGAVRQQSGTNDLIFPVEQLISDISRFITLETGDILFTGTPQGVSRVQSGDRLEAALSDSAGTILASLAVRVR